MAKNNRNVSSPNLALLIIKAFKVHDGEEHDSFVRILTLQLLESTDGYPIPVILHTLFSVALFYISKQDNPAELGAHFADGLKEIVAACFDRPEQVS